MLAPLKVCLFFFAVLALGAALAPGLFWAGQASGSAFLRGTDFARYFNRSVLLAAVALLPLLAKWLGLRGMVDLGLRKNAAAGRHAAGGFALGLGGLWTLGAIGLALGAYRWKMQGAGVLASATGAAALSAVGAAALEEGFFRGALQGVLVRSARARGRAGWGALGFVAALFAVVHFLKPPGAGAPGGEIEAVNWTTGFAQIPRAFWQFGRPGLVLAGWTTLLLVGLILGWARWRTESLWAGFGLHAGWIFGLKLFAKFTRRAADNTGWPWFGESLLIGAGPVAMLAITGALTWWWLGPKAAGGRRRVE